MKRWYICILLLLLLAVPVTGRAEETPKPELQGDPRLEVVDVDIEQGVIINIELKAQNCRMASKRLRSWRLSYRPILASR